MAKVTKFRHKETGHVWDVDQQDLHERLSADKDFEVVADAPVLTPTEAKAAADKAAAEAGNS